MRNRATRPLYRLDCTAADRVPFASAAHTSEIEIIAFVLQDRTDIIRAVCACQAFDVLRDAGVVLRRDAHSALTGLRTLGSSGEIVFGIWDAIQLSPVQGDGDTGVFATSRAKRAASSGCERLVGAFHLILAWCGTLSAGAGIMHVVTGERGVCATSTGRRSEMISGLPCFCCTLILANAGILTGLRGTAGPCRLNRRGRAGRGACTGRTTKAGLVTHVNSPLASDHGSALGSARILSCSQTRHRSR